MNGDHQPGSVIQPGSQQGATPQSPAPPVSPPSSVSVSPVAAAQLPQAPAPQPPIYDPAPQPPQPPSMGYAQADDGLVSWTASEYIAHQKNSGWWLGFVGILLVAAALVYLITQDIFSVVVIAGVFGAAGYYARRKPTVQQYSIDDDGVHIGSKVYAFSQLKSFSIVRQGAFSSIQFVPMRRFMPYIPMYYAPEQENAIFDALVQYLPFEAERRQDPIDHLMHKIRF